MASGLGDLGKLVARLEADSSKFVAELKTANRHLDESKRKAETSIGGISGYFSKLRTGAAAAVSSLKSVALGVAAIGGAGVGLVALVKHNAELVDQLAKTARRVGLTTEALQTLDYQIQLAGGDTAALSKGLDLFNNYLGQAKVNQGTLYTYLSRTNPELLNQLKATKSTGAALQLYGDAIRHATNAQDAMALSRAAFGRSGAQMVLLFKQSKGALDAQAESARRLGLVIDTRLAKATEHLNDTMTTAGEIFRVNFARGILEATTGATDFQKALEDPKAQQALADFSKDVGEAAGALASFAAKAGAAYDTAKRWAVIIKDANDPLKLATDLLKQHTDAVEKDAAAQQKAQLKALGMPGYGGGYAAPPSASKPAPAPRPRTLATPTAPSASAPTPSAHGVSWGFSPAVSFGAELQFQEGAARDAKRVIDQFAQSAKAVQDSAPETKSAWDQAITGIGQLGASTFDQLVKNWVGGSRQGFAQIAVDFGIQLAEMVAKAEAANLAGYITGGSGGGGGSSTGSTASSIVSILGSVVGVAATAFAGGGHVSSPTLAIVGERGPETIIPDRKLATLAGGGIKIEINNRSSGATVQRPQIQRGNDGEMALRFAVTDAVMRDIDERGPIYQRLVAGGVAPYGGHLR